MFFSTHAWGAVSQERPKKLLSKLPFKTNSLAGLSDWSQRVRVVF